MNKSILNILIIISITAIVCVLFIKSVQRERYRNNNCERVYYDVNCRECVRYVSRPMMIGKVVTARIECVEYKDTVRTEWKWKCPN